MVKKIIKCPKCGQKNLFPSDECTTCGSSFVLFPELRALLEKEKQRNGEVKEPISKTDDQREKALICPKCGQENDSLSVECSKCGIVFLKYYEIRARDETDEKKKAELLRKQKEEEEKAELLRKQKEKEEEEKAEALRKKKEEEEKAEALRKKKEEEEKAEKEAQEKAEALRKQKEEEEKAELLRKQKEEEEEEAEALRKKKEEEEKAELLRKQKEKEEEEEKAEALRKQKEEEEKELQKRLEDITKVLKPKQKIKDLLKKYEGQTIGINYDSPTEIKGANLVRVGDDIFSIFITDDELMKSYPLRNIISVIEGVNGVRAGNMEENSAFSLVIQVYYQVF